MMTLIKNSAVVPRGRVVMVVLWPAFLMACVASGVIFSLVDPGELILLDRHFHLSNLGAYTLGFLLFWLLGCIASSLTALLMLEWHHKNSSGS